MKATNQLVQRERKTFSMTINGDAMQGMIRKSLGDTKAAARFTSTLISAVAASPQLQNCKNETIISSALRGEGMGLIYGHGYWLVPYGDTCTFSLSYKGLIQLAMSTGAYADIDCVDVREGEYKGRNKRTGKPDIDLATYDTDEEREQHPIIGYYAYYELVNGIFRYEYWSIDRLLKHADHYVKAFDLDKYRKYIAGELSQDEIQRIQNGSPWYDVGGGQNKMFAKTVLRALLNSGFAPLSAEVKDYVRFDADEQPNFPDMPSFVDNNPEPVPVAPELPMEAMSELPNEAVETVTVDTVGDEKPKRGRPKKTATVPADNGLTQTEPAPDMVSGGGEFIDDFFG